VSIRIDQPGVLQVLEVDGGVIDASGELEPCILQGGIVRWIKLSIVSGPWNC